MGKSCRWLEQYADVVAKAIRAKNAGMKIMIDFHYSDSWADPGHQTKPAAWAHKISTTYKHLFMIYTYCNEYIKIKWNIIPEWVQVGNETNDGMLWPEGKASANMTNFASLINAGYDAVKSVSDSFKSDCSYFQWL